MSGPIRFGFYVFPAAMMDIVFFFLAFRFHEITHHANAQQGMNTAGITKAIMI